jgi:hypothetical protein
VAIQSAKIKKNSIFALLKFFTLMKKKICSSCIILFSVFFFILSSGIVINIHEHCCKHQHAKNEHNHCHEIKVFLKIKDGFIKSKTTLSSFSPVETILFSPNQIHHVFEIVTPYFRYAVPPLLKLVGVNFVNFTSQRVFYS